ncbi:sister-chromatid cohesion protein 3 [Nymphaea colorata]|nr:sister-chromatid cohesion protein 3 [Nymphaea colorata]XP_031486002.1 sister-chromatid cohesion protein 3 [Nymphaea colorata]XP_049933934.1 sister-chromatid cohesion protein 3 [Nymphaea colorata]
METGLRRSQRRLNAEESKRGASAMSSSEKAASNSAKDDDQSPTRTEQVSVRKGRKRRENGSAATNDAEPVSPTEVVDEDFEGSPPDRRKKKKREVAADHQSLIETIKSNGKFIHQAVKNWVEQYESDPKFAVAEILLMLFEACGVKYQFAEVSMDEVNVDDVVVALVTLTKNGQVEDYGGAKQKVFKQFKENLLCFWDSLVLECQNGPLFDSVLFEKCMDYVIALSCTPPRIFRHVATSVGLQLVTSFITVAKTLGTQRETTQRQVNAEKKKRKEGPRLESLKKRLSETHEKITVMEEMMRKIFTGLFMHRYRDIDPDIRMACIGSLGNWIVSYPSLFLQDLYLKYLGWTLNDKSAGVRKTSISALQNLYEIDDNVPSLSLFTERFSNRMIELADDIDVAVAVSAVGLLKQLLRHQLLADDELGPLYDLLIDEHPAIRHAVGELVYDHLIAQKFSSSQSSSKGKESESSEVHIGRLLQILREFSMDPILSTYVIDDIWEHMDALKDWKCIISMLLDENPLTELTDIDATSLVRLLCASIKKAVGEKIVPSNDNRKVYHTKAQKETLENNKHEITINMMKRYAQILQKFVADKAKVAPLVEAVVHLKLELYSLKRQEQNFQAVLQLIKDAFFKHGENETLRSCIKSIAFCASESPADLQDFARNKLKELEDELLSKLKSAITQIGAGDDDYSLLVNLRRCYNFQLAKAVSNESLYEDLVGILRDFKNLDDEVVSLLLLNMYMHVLWCRQSLDEENPSEASLSSLLSMRSTLFQQLDYFLNYLLNAEEEEKAIALLTSRVCVILVEIWCIFNERKLRSSKLHLLGFLPDESTIQKFWKLCERRLSIKDGLDDEDANEESIDEINRQDAIMIAAAKLIVNDVVPKELLAPKIISHFIMHGPSVAEVVKNFIAVLKKTASDDIHKLFLEALKIAYQRHEEELSRTDGDYSSVQSFSDCKDLSSRLSATFAGAARSKHRLHILEIVKNGIAFAFEDAPKKLSFLEGSVLQFVPKLPVSDIMDILKDIQTRVEDINTDEDPSGWRPYHAFIDILREKYTKNEGLQGEEGQVQKRRGRPPKSKDLQGRKLFEDQNSSEEDGDGDSISASDQDEDEEDDETPLRNSLRSLRLRSLKLGKASQQERSNDSRSNAQSKHVGSGKATLDKVFAS